MQYGDTVDNTVEDNSRVFFPNPNVLVAVYKGLQPVKLHQHASKD